MAGWFKAGRLRLRKKPEAVIWAKLPEALGGAVKNAAPRDCATCQYKPLEFARPGTGPERRGECRNPAEMFPPVVAEVRGVFWKSGTPVACGCRYHEARHD